MPILVFLGLSVLELGPMYATDRRQTASSLNAPHRGRGHNNSSSSSSSRGTSIRIRSTNDWVMRSIRSVCWAVNGTKTCVAR